MKISLLAIVTAITIFTFYFFEHKINSDEGLLWSKVFIGFVFVVIPFLFSLLFFWFFLFKKKTEFFGGTRAKLYVYCFAVGLGICMFVMYIGISQFVKIVD